MQSNSMYVGVLICNEAFCASHYQHFIITYILKFLAFTSIFPASDCPCTPLLLLCFVLDIIAFL